MRISIKQLRRLIREAITQATPAANPDPNCPECHGTGLYTGFNSIETCQTCSSRKDEEKKEEGWQGNKGRILFVSEKYFPSDFYFVYDGIHQLTKEKMISFEIRRSTTILSSNTTSLTSSSKTTTMS